jgi:ankyrin repeat protein
MGHDIVRAALAAGANPNGRLQGTKRFPLHEAALRGNPSIAATLLRSGAEVDLLDDEKYTPLAMSFRASPMGDVANL